MSNYKGKSTRINTPDDLANRKSLYPILSPQDICPSDTTSKIVGVLNPTIFEYNEKKIIIFRVDEQLPSNYKNCNNHFLAWEGDTKINKQKFYIPYRSHLRIGILQEGNGVDNITLIKNHNNKIYYHIEDPRLNLINNKLYITYNKINKFGSTSWLGELELPHTIKNTHMILGPDHKHTCIFPQKINSKYIILTRPLTRLALKTTGVWMLSSPDLVHYGNAHPLLIPRKHCWDSQRTGACGTPVKINEGWLILYFGVDGDNSYHIGAAIMDFKHPHKILLRSKEPILSPTLGWEKNGRRADTVFSGGFLVKDNKVTIIYGGADAYLGIAEVNLNILLNSME